MDGRGRRGVLLACALAAGLAGCSDLEPFSLLDTGACTAIGNAEGVSVDLTGVLDLEGGDYFAEVAVEELGVSGTTGFAGNDEYGLGGGVAADLTSAPVTVTVVVREEAGAVAYSAEDVATPRLHQPNGPRCDGENYRVLLVAQPDGSLTARPEDEHWEYVDEQGRTSIAIATQCGIEGIELLLDEASLTYGWFARVGGRLDDGAGGPPPGWNAPYQRGWLLRDGTTATYTDDAGRREVFELVPGATAPLPTCSF